MAVLQCFCAVLLCIYVFCHNVRSTKTSTNITFGITLGKHEKSNSYSDLTLTLYWNSTIHQCTVKPNEPSRTYECDLSKFWQTTECIHNTSASESTVNGFKLTLEHSSYDTLDIDTIYVTIDGKYFEIDYFFTNLTWESAEYLRYKSNSTNEWYDAIGLGSDYYECVSIIMDVSNDNESYLMFEDNPAVCQSGTLNYTIEHEKELTFTQAETHCQLASIHNVNDLGRIIAQRDNIEHGEMRSLWIGLMYDLNDSKWKWLDGTECDDTELCLGDLWQNGQPEKDSDIIEYCGAIHKHDLIHTFPCEVPLWFVCNKESDPISKNSGTLSLSVEAILIISFGTAILCIVVIVLRYIRHVNQSQKPYMDPSVSTANVFDDFEHSHNDSMTHAQVTPMPQIIEEIKEPDEKHKFIKGKETITVQDRNFDGHGRTQFFNIQKMTE